MRVGKHPTLITTLALAACAWLPVSGQGAPAGPNPGNTLELGFEGRVRSEEWTNIVDHSNALNDDRLHYRMRSRAWAVYTVGSDLELAAGIVNENRKIVRPDVAFNGREVIFETLSAKYRFNADWSAKIGRQSLAKGEGFILMEGGALDGSRTFYFNAATVTRSFSHGSLDFMAISNPSRDHYLPRLNATDNPKELMRLTEWNEQALGLYYTGKLNQGRTVEGYCFYKTELKDYRAATHPMFQPDRRLTTLGGRLTQDLGQGWLVTSELAGQAGTQDANPAVLAPSKAIGAWAGYARAKKSFSAPWKPSFMVGYLGMSGTDPRSNRIGGWDPIFSRWPAFSELYVYTQIPEKGVSYGSNTNVWQAEVRLSPCAALDLRATYCKLGAFQAPLVADATFGTGKDRGDLWQVRADLKMTSWLKGHVLYEHLAPGNFHAVGDAGHFFKVELSCLFKTIL